jgi:hypothetical protein
MNEDWKPTARLRLVNRSPPPGTEVAPGWKLRILQQWFAPDVPSYMLGDEGEWRDIPVGDET